MKYLYRIFPIMLCALLIAATGCSEELVSPEATVEQTAESAPKSLEEFAQGLPIVHLDADYAAEMPEPSAELEEARQRYLSAEDEAASKDLLVTNYRRYGPYGGNGGTAWNGALRFASWDNSRRLSQVTVYAGRYVDAIEFWWVNDQNWTYYGGKHGGSGGVRYDIPFAPGEHITAVTVRHGRLVDNISIRTNYAVYTTGWGTGGTRTYVNASAAGRQIHGFFGREGDHLDQIGFYSYYPSDLTR